MKLSTAVFMFTPLLFLPACVDGPDAGAGTSADAATVPQADDLPAAGTAHVWTPGGVLEVAYHRDGDHVVFQEDMMVSVAAFRRAMLDQAELDEVLAGEPATVSRAAVRALGRYRWPGGVVRWRYDAALTTAQQNQVQLAITHWTNNTNINFVQAADTTGDFVEFRPGNGDGLCRADVGRMGGEQELEVDNCSWQALVHELGHTIGFYHEQTRFDRDNHVVIHWDAIQSSRVNDFKRYVDHPQGRDGTDNGPYDYGSIMHYGPFAGAIDGPNTPNRRPTITTWPAGITIGQRNGLSLGDIDAANRMYTFGGTSVITDDGPEAILWSAPSYTGTVVSLRPGMYEASEGALGPVGDNNLSSMNIPSGLGVQVWTDLFSGSSTWLGGNLATMPAGFDNNVSRVQVRRAVTVFRDPGRSGVSQTFPIGEWKANAGDLAIVGNDTISSLYVPPGLVAELCWSETGVGSTGSYCSTYEGGGINLVSELDNQTSLIRVKPAVTIYSDANMLGYSKALTYGTWVNTALAPVGNDKISSVVVGEGLRATLCDTLAGGGTCETMRGDVIYVGGALNDHVSWVKVENGNSP